MKRKNRHILNTKGLTLVEVIVAITILLMAAEIISISVTFTARMNTRSREIANADQEVGKKIQDKSEGVTGTMQMQIQGFELSNEKEEDARLYSENAGKDGNGFQVHALWADDAVMEDLYMASGVTAPELPGRQEINGLPEDFPELIPRTGAEDGGDEKIHQVEADIYCTRTGEGEDEDGGILFHNDVPPTDKTSFVILDGNIDISVSGSYTAAGVTVMEINNMSLNTDRISLWMGAEIYHLSGELEFRYTDKKTEKSVIPIHMYLVPESGHKQPALVFVEPDTKLLFYRTSEEEPEGKLERSITFTQSAWYAIPSDGSTGSVEEQEKNARDLLKLTAEDWESYRLYDGNENLGDGAVDKAFARLILAGVIDSPNKSASDDN